MDEGQATEQGTSGQGTLQERADALGRAIYLGGSPLRFEEDGRQILISLIRRGLTFDSPLIDVGCGALRGGYWLIHFLDPDRYHGIEPVGRRVDEARRALLEPGVEEQKRPRFANNADWDLGVFGIAPRFVVARSIWSHAPKSAIAALLDSFAKVAAPDGLLLASYVPAVRAPRATSGLAGVADRVRRELSSIAARRRSRGRAIVPGSRAAKRQQRIAAKHHKAGAVPRTDYLGDDWGNPEEGGLVAHRFEWIADQCTRRGLVATESKADRFGVQTWVEIRRAR
jgi:hypothetical protein